MLVLIVTHLVTQTPVSDVEAELRRFSEVVVAGEGYGVAVIDN
ncbi:hypothetical protein [Micromonospora carbonacea]